MQVSSNKLLLKKCCIALLAAAFTVIGLLGTTSETAAQETGRSSILVILAGDFRGITNVEVELKGANLAEPMVTTTFFPGLALFRRLESGTYAVTPRKEGYTYNPLSQSVTLEDRPFGDRELAFFIASVPPLEVPYEELWASSAHADASSESFNHWNEDGEVEAACAKCHSTPGFLDFLGEDGTAAGTVENPAPVGTVIECIACHNETASSLTSVTFPSGATVTGISDEARCMQCHQGRSSTTDVDEAIAAAAPATDDTVDPDLRFINIHYYAAASTLYGKVAMGGYQYAGKSYDAKFAHVEEFDTCIGCHDPHSLQLKVESCAACHPGDDLLDIRYVGSLVDYDGDGNITEGIYYEIEDLQMKLYDAIKTYAADVAGTAIVYDPLTYPYFLKDTNGDGVGDGAYDTWTARLVRAAYNYQTSLKDPGAFAHGGKYIIELLYDSIEDLNIALAALTPPAAIDLTGVSRTDEGHFDGSSEAWRHWDEDGAVEGDCAKCHSAEGLPIFIENETNIAAEISNGLLCSTCHENLTDFALRVVEEVTFPSGLSADLGDGNNLCLNCHQGREAKATVDATIAAEPGPYSFINIHYYAAAASLLGADVEAGYEYEGKSYAGQNTFSAHGGGLDTCVTCHMGSTHNVAGLNPSSCAPCHGGASFTFEDFRTPGTPDFDGDGDAVESRLSEILGLEEALFAEIQSYAAAQGKPIAYDGDTYPYFVNDTNGNGVADSDELSRSNSYQDFDATLLKAAFNYQVSKKEPCGYIHNATYIAQLMVDSIQSLGGSVGAYTWR